MGKGQAILVFRLFASPHYLCFSSSLYLRLLSIFISPAHYLCFSLLSLLLLNIVASPQYLCFSSLSLPLLIIFAFSHCICVSSIYLRLLLIIFDFPHLSFPLSAHYRRSQTAELANQRGIGFNHSLLTDSTDAFWKLHKVKYIWTQKFFKKCRN